ncbi:MAG: ribonuclease III [Clostridia bacterium]|nr:ribonuclease III [Clostridia bacterium]
MENELLRLQKEIGYTFRDADILTLALTHSSYTNESRQQCNERLEFLGDSVLNFITADYLFSTYPDTDEGTLTKIRSASVCRESLSDFAKSLDLGDFLILGKGEELSGGRSNPSILENACEAVIAAIYLDGGLDEARRFILPSIRKTVAEHRITDFKSKLQEFTQSAKEGIPLYRVTDESGPSHKRKFTVEASLNGNVIGRGTGTTKKEAEQNAAREALTELFGICDT